MKKILFVLAAVAVITPACQKSSEVAPSAKKTSITVGIDNTLTKTQLAGTVDLLWSAGDAILITASDYSYKIFTLEGSGGTASGTFSINEEVTIMGGTNGSQSFYPETLNPTYNSVEDKTHVILPDTYTWTAAGVKAPMYGWLNKTTPWDYFKLMTSVIKVDVYNIPATACKLVFTAAAESVSGDFIFPYDCIPVKAGDTNKSITINFTAGEATMRSFCIPVPYGAYSAGATFVLKNSADEALVTKTAPAITVGKESFSYFPAINCDNSTVSTLISDAKDCTVWSKWNQVDGLSTSSFKAGDRLRFNVTEEGGDTYWQLKPQYAYEQVGSDWHWKTLEGDGLIYGLCTGQTFLDVVMSESVVAALKERPSLTVQGYNVTVNSVQYIPQTEVVIWEGTHDLGNWDNCFDVSGLNSAAIWSNLKAGKELTVYFHEGSSPDIDYCQFFIKQKVGGSDILSFNAGTNHNQTVVSFPLTADHVAFIKTNGIVIWGKRIVITKITLR